MIMAKSRISRVNPWICTLLVLCLVVAIDLGFSWRGSGAPPVRECITINLGFQPDEQAAKLRALNQLAEAVHKHPASKYFEVRWVKSLFFGWYTDNEWWLDYDRQNKQLILGDGINLGNDPDESWVGVNEEMLSNIARHGFNHKYLISIGCQNRDPA